ncbi:MAG: hypothetical protein VX028_03030 [Nanoarchaeota archaeon]|nr:hypothetical protein [Nanoarchaeota archaeon]
MKLTKSNIILGIVFLFLLSIRNILPQKYEELAHPYLYYFDMLSIFIFFIIIYLIGKYQNTIKNAEKISVRKEKKDDLISAKKVYYNRFNKKYNDLTLTYNIIKKYVPTSILLFTAIAWNFLYFETIMFINTIIIIISGLFLGYYYLTKYYRKSYKLNKNYGK